MHAAHWKSYNFWPEQPTRITLCNFNLTNPSHHVGASFLTLFSQFCLYFPASLPNILPSQILFEMVIYLSQRTSFVFFWEVFEGEELVASFLDCEASQGLKVDTLFHCSARTHSQQCTMALVLLAPTGALIVIVCYY